MVGPTNFQPRCLSAFESAVDAGVMAGIEERVRGATRSLSAVAKLQRNAESEPVAQKCRTEMGSLIDRRQIRQDDATGTEGIDCVWHDFPWFR